MHSTLLNKWNMQSYICEDYISVTDRALALSTRSHPNTCGCFLSPLDCRLIGLDVSSTWSASWHKEGLQDVFSGCTMSKNWEC